MLFCLLSIASSWAHKYIIIHKCFSTKKKLCSVKNFCRTRVLYSYWLEIIVEWKLKAIYKKSFADMSYGLIHLVTDCYLRCKYFLGTWKEYEEESEKQKRVRAGTRKMNVSISRHDLDYKLCELLRREWYGWK